MPEIWIIAVHYKDGAIDKVRTIKSDSTRRFVRAVASQVEEAEREHVLLWINVHKVPVLTARARRGGLSWEEFERGAVVEFERGAVVEPTPDDIWITTEADGKVYTNLEHLPRY